MTETLTYQTIKTANQAREAEEAKTENRKKKLIILILQWLTEEGYAETARSFEKETNLDLKRYDVCDNIDLDTVLQEYESYYYVRFNRYPKVIKKVSNTNISNKIAKTTSNRECKSAKAIASDSLTRKQYSNVPVLPKVNNSAGAIPPVPVPVPPTSHRPTSSEHPHIRREPTLHNFNTPTNNNHNSHNNHNNHNNGNNNNQKVEIKVQNQTLFSSESTLNLRKNKNNNTDKNNNSTLPTMDSTEEFGLSVTKIDSMNGNKQANSVISNHSNSYSIGNNNGTNNNNNNSNNNSNNSNNNNAVVQRRKAGQIIDFRTMINEATKLNVEEGANNNNNNDPSDRLMKPLAGYIGYNSEWRELAQVISRDIYMHNPDVKWDDIIGLEAAKRTIKEAVVYPIKYPQLFTGILSPWKGLLLYGPPGTGKTLLAKAVATECNTTFFNISASSIVSKWRGDSEKLVRVLFEMARFYAPSTIFMDELESIMSIRGSTGGGGEHEGSRRMKTELLVQMDGLAKTEDLVFLLAASNIPWELDHAMLRRLEKRIIVDLPTYEARLRMFRHHLPEVVIQEQNGLTLSSDLDYEKLANATEGYSGSDIKLVCKEAAMRSVRKVFAALENFDESAQVTQLKLDKITTEDVQRVLLSTKPSAKQFVHRYEAWSKEYESV